MRSKYICGIIKSSENDYILEFNQYMNLYKIPYNVYADNESLIKKQMDVQIIQKILQEQKLESIFIVDNSMSPIWAFDHIKDKHIGEKIV